MSIEIEKSVLFGKTQVLSDISLDIASVKWLPLLGLRFRKTTLLRIIGLEQQSQVIAFSWSRC